MKDFGRDHRIILDNFAQKQRFITIDEFKKRKIDGKLLPYSFGGNSVGCGDRISFLVAKEGQLIRRIFFTSEEACLVAVSSANVISAWIENNQPSSSQLLQLTNEIGAMLADREYNLLGCDEMTAFRAIGASSNRRACLQLIIDSFRGIATKD